MRNLISIQPFESEDDNVKSLIRCSFSKLETRSSKLSRFCAILTFGIVFIFSHDAHAQVATGTPPFGSFGGGPEVINLYNLNFHWVFPIVNKAGRGPSFNYALTYDSSVWQMVTVNGQDTWQPVNGTLGWQRQTDAITGYVSYNAGTTGCGTVYGQFVYHSPNGTAYQFNTPGINGMAIWSAGCGEPTSGNGVTYDDSGYTIFVTSVPTLSATVYPPSGGSITPPAVASTQNPTGSARITDTNGNSISTNDGVTFTDTTGATVLTMSNNGGGVAFPTSFTYTAPGGSKTISVSYTGYNVQTNFGCPTILDYPATFIPLLTSITYPDQSSYQITYEDTPGYPGSKTGRISQVTLPTGGTISYSYPSGCNGIHSDGSTTALTRTVNDGTNSYTWQYSTSIGPSQTFVLDPQGNETDINFPGIYETQRQIYSGRPSTGGTLLETVLTCYDNDPNCSASSIVSGSITVRDVRTTLNTMTSRVKTTYDSSGMGLPVEIDNYDFTGSTWGNPLKKTLITYATNLGNIVGRPNSVTVEDGNNNVLADTEYRYDEYGLQSTASNNPPVPQHGNSPQSQRANVTTVSQLVQGTTYLAKHFTYYDTGTPNSAQDVNGQNTIYNYDPTASCGYSYVTSVTAPITSLVSYSHWNCDGGVMTSATDANSQVTSFAYNDPNFWRPTSVTDPLGNVTQTNYAGPTLSETSMWFNNNNSFTDSIPILDGLGRPHVMQQRQGPGNLLSVFDSVETDYDSNGRPSLTTVGYVASSIGQSYCNSRNPPQGNCTPPGTTTTYDALNRPLHVQDAGGGTVDYSYNANDVLITVGSVNNVGDSAKQRQYEYDSLGRLTSVCEVTSGSGSGSCGQTNALTGYWTKYTYDALGDLTGVTQNAQAAQSSQQTRIFAYDGLGRMTGQNDPETGNTQVVYDSDAPCGITSAGDLIRRQDNAGNETCYQYDAMHRVTMISYAGPNAGSMPVKHFVYDSATVNGQTMLNAKGRLARAYTCTTCTPTLQVITDEGFSYSVRGETTDVYQSTPHSGGYYDVKQTYWNHGLPGTLSNLPGLPSITYGSFTGNGGLDGEGRVIQVSAYSGLNPVVPAVSYNNTDPGTSSEPLGALLSINLATTTSGQYDSDSFTYDPNTERLTKYTFSVGSPAQTDVGQLTWNANGSLQQLQITDGISGAQDTQTCTYTHDDLGRIASVNCGSSIWQQNFGYDPFGNITKTVPQGSMGMSFPSTPNAYNTATNKINLTGYSYDNNGNLLTDATGSHQYSWDAEGKAVCMDNIVLTYDAMGRMVEQARGGTCANPGTTYQQIVYSPGGDKLALMNGQTLSEAFVPLPGGATAVYTSTGLAYYRHSDHLGSSRLATTPARTPYYTGAYAPFGENYAENGNTDRSFTGQNQDTIGGIAPLDDFMFREHTPNQGRWISPDPAGLGAVNPTDPQTWNRYAYVANRPLTSVDALGLETAVSENGYDCQFYSLPDPGTGDPEYDGEGTCPSSDDSSGDDPSQIFADSPPPSDLPTIHVDVWQEGWTILDPHEFGVYNSLAPNLPPVPEQPNWYVSFATSFVKNFSLSGLNGKRLCTVVALDNLQDELNPFAYDHEAVAEGTADAVGEGTETFFKAAAFSYAASRTLSVPLRSPAFRGLMAGAEFAGKASAVVTAGFVYYDILRSTKETMSTASAGECAGIFE